MTRGPQPKPNAVRRNAHPTARSLPAAGPVEGRALPTSLGIKTAGAKRFWRTWATAPQTTLWTETDWAELEITVKLVDALFQGDTRLAGEIRQRVAKWGARVEDRNRLRLSVEDETEEEAPPVSNSEMDEELFNLLNE